MLAQPGSLERSDAPAFGESEAEPEIAVGTVISGHVGEEVPVVELRVTQQFFGPVDRCPRQLA